MSFNANQIFSILFLIVSFLLLAVSVHVERRRFQNSFFLLIFMFAVTVFLIENFSGSWLAGLLALYNIVFFFILFLVVPLLLIINGFVMIRREGLSLANLLSLFFGLMVYGGEAALIFGLRHYFTQPSWISFLAAAGGITVFYIGFIFLDFMFYSVFMQVIPRRSSFDYVIVLGAGLINGSKVSRLLAERLNKGIKVYRKSGGNTKIICSGGQGADEDLPEADAMKQYLIEQGIPEDDIITEDQSKNTEENLRNSYEIIKRRGGEKNIAVVTTNYHVLRALILSRRLNIPCTGIAAPVRMYYWPSAMIREFVALLKEYYIWNIFGVLLFLSPLIITALFRLF